MCHVQKENPKNTFTMTDDEHKYRCAAQPPKDVKITITRITVKLSLNDTSKEQKRSYRCFTWAGCRWSWPACAPVQREQSVCDAEACGSLGPGGGGSAACSTARQRRDPAETPPAHLQEGETWCGAMNTFNKLTPHLYLLDSGEAPPPPTVHPLPSSFLLPSEVGGAYVLTATSIYVRLIFKKGKWT